MSIDSLKPKTNRNGGQYYDKLFSGIHRSQDTLEVKFYSYRINEVEAQNVVSALPMFIKEELNIDPTCFFHQSDFNYLMEGTWDKTTREYKSRSMINQEQYLNELEDCFRVNREFLPEIIIPDTSTQEQDMAKHVAMANGQDDISMISNLTDKTLKAATTVPQQLHDRSEASSLASGYTSKSKTQLAVKEALKEVSIEHNKAMVEQQKLFQKELDALKKQFTQNLQAGMTIDVQTQLNEGTEDQDGDTMMDDEIAADIAEAREHFKKLAETTNTSSPVTKRTRRSKSRQRKGGGGHPSTQASLNE
jgi:hypothetical protein